MLPPRTAGRDFIFYIPYMKSPSKEKWPLQGIIPHPEMVPVIGSKNNFLFLITLFLALKSQVYENLPTHA
jgi:hypothetical protein